MMSCIDAHINNNRLFKKSQFKFIRSLYKNKGIGKKIRLLNESSMNLRPIVCGSGALCCMNNSVRETGHGGSCALTPTEKQQPNLQLGCCFFMALPSPPMDRSHPASAGPDCGRIGYIGCKDSPENLPHCNDGS